MADRNKNDTTAELIAVDSLLDFVRGACQFGSSFTPIYTFREGNENRLISVGEVFDGEVAAYYLDVPSISRYLLYNTGGDEAASWSDDTSAIGDFQSYRLHVVPLEGTPFPKTGEIGGVNVLRMGDYKDLIKLLVYKGIEEEAIQNAYTFELDGKTRIGGFDLIKGTDMHTFTHAPLEIEKPFNFFRYNYTEDKPEMTDTLQHITADFYVKVVHLRGVFGFLKDKDMDKRPE